jgi:hypothetical protein
MTARRHFRLFPQGNRARTPRALLHAMVSRDRERTEHLEPTNPRRRPTLARVKFLEQPEPRP